MADSYRLQVLKALTEHLQTITMLDGLPVDFTSSVFRGRTVFGDGYPIPMLSLLEAPQSGVRSTAGDNLVARDEWWTIFVQGWAENDPVNPTDNVYPLLEAVEVKLAELSAIKTDGSGRPEFPDAYMLGNMVVGIEVGAGICRPAQEQVSSKAFFYLPLRLRLAR